MDVKKLGWIPDGAAARPWTLSRSPRSGIGFDYIQAVIDDHTRLAYAEICPDEKGTTAAALVLSATGFFRAKGTRKIGRLITDDAFSRKSPAFRAAAAQAGAQQRLIKPHCPGTNGEIERLNRILAPDWADDARPSTSNTEKAAAPKPWLNHDDTECIHTASRAARSPG